MAEDAATTEAITHRTRMYRRAVRQSFKGSLNLAGELGQLSDTETTHKAELLVGLTLGFNISVRGGATKPEQKALLSAVTAQLDDWRSTPRRD